MHPLGAGAERVARSVTSHRSGWVAGGGPKLTSRGSGRIGAAMRRLILASIVSMTMTAAVPAAGAVRGRPCRRVTVPSNPVFISYHIRAYAIGCAKARAVVRQYMLTWQRGARCRALADDSPYVGCRMRYGFRCELGA